MTLGTLTDKGMNDNGVMIARISVDGAPDQPFEVLSYVLPFLEKCEKGGQVEFTTKDRKISKIAPVRKGAGAMPKGDSTEKREAAGFDNPPESVAAETKRKEDEKGDQRIAENNQYIKEITQQQSGGSCTSPAVPVVQLVPVHPAPLSYSEDEMLLLRNVIAKGCTEPEFKLLMYMANTYGLDPLLKQIWAVKRNENQPALIFAGRDGMLAIAHRSGHFDGMQSGVIYDKDRKPVTAWCEIWRNDMTHSFKTEVPFSEYNTGFSVWKTNPSAMILKVAESVCLRKAFSVSGLYCPEEIDTGVQ